MMRFCRNLFRSISPENKKDFAADFRRPPFLFGTEVFSLSEFNTKARREENLRDGHRKGFLFSGGQSQTAKRILIRRIEILEVNLNYNYFSPSLSFEVKIQGINKKVTFLSCVNTAAKKSLI